jgi:hypothetical protein
MDKTPTTKPAPAEAVAVDYDHLDVAELGQKIQAAAARNAPVEAAPPLSVPAAVSAPAVSAAPAASGPGLKTRLKGKAARLLSPLFPLMRALALPLHEDVAAVVRSLDASNKRVDDYMRTLDRSVEYVKLLHLLNHNLVVEMTKLRLEHEALKSRMRLMERDLEFLTKRERTVEERVFTE